MPHMVKNLPATWETRVGSLHREDSLEKGMTTTPVFLPGESHVSFLPLIKKPFGAAFISNS